MYWRRHCQDKEGLQRTRGVVNFTSLVWVERDKKNPIVDSFVIGPISWGQVCGVVTHIVATEQEAGGVELHVLHVLLVLHASASTMNIDDFFGINVLLHQDRGPRVKQARTDPRDTMTDREFLKHFRFR